MKATDVLESLVHYARIVREDVPKSVLIRNKHMNDLKGDEIIPQEVVDAILVDFINQIGVYQRIDFGLYTKDLKEKKEEP